MLLKTATAFGSYSLVSDTLHKIQRGLSHYTGRGHVPHDHLGITQHPRRIHRERSCKGPVHSGSEKKACYSLNMKSTPPFQVLNVCPSATGGAALRCFRKFRRGSLAGSRSLGVCVCV